MSKLRVHCFGISLDGFSAGPNQDINHPLGIKGMDLMQWFFPTRVFQAMHGGGKDGATGIDNDFAERSFQHIGAWIMGRNMFGPVRGQWLDDSWKGWWGDNPPYHTQVFVLTHHPRPSLEMAGGTTFHFITDGIHAALQRAQEAAGELDVRIGGGPATVRQYLQAGLIDEIHLVASPTVLGSGERLLEGIDLLKLGYRCKEQVMSTAAMHVVLAK
jgi:dihydrofolate reductase